MRSSSGNFEVGLEGRAGLQDGPQDVDAAPGQSDDGLMVAFALAPFTGVESAAVGAGRASRSRTGRRPV